MPSTPELGRSGLRLRLPLPGDETAVRAAHEELLDDGFRFCLGDGAWPEQLDRYERARLGVGLPAGRVPMTFLLAVVGGDGDTGERLVGRSSIRHRLNEDLLEVGGHVGYAVRPASRGRGYATEILRQSLDVLRDLHGVDRALVTCDDDNAASARTIERNGGVLEDVRPPGTEGGAAKRRYWIDLRPRRIGARTPAGWPH